MESAWVTTPFRTDRDVIDPLAALLIGVLLGGISGFALGAFLL